MSTAVPTPDGPTPDDVQRGLADVERFLAEQTPPAPVTEVAETGRVRALRAEVSEARALLGLQADEAPLLVDTPKVRKRRKQAAEAAQLHALAQHPATRAWQAARMRRLLTWLGVGALCLGLGWSISGVQEFAAQGKGPDSPDWWFAWLVEPSLSLALLLVVAARAFMGTRGQPLDHPTLRKIEGLFLTVTLAMNAWPHLPGVAESFSLGNLAKHVIGPIIAMAVVKALPIIYAAFDGLDHGPAPGQSYRGATAPTYRANTASQTPGAAGATEALVARARLLITSGQLDENPSATRLREVLRCGMDAARDVRDALRGEA